VGRHTFPLSALLSAFIALVNAFLELPPALENGRCERSRENVELTSLGWNKVLSTQRRSAQRCQLPDGRGAAVALISLVNAVLELPPALENGRCERSRENVELTSSLRSWPGVPWGVEPVGLLPEQAWPRRRKPSGGLGWSRSGQASALENALGRRLPGAVFPRDRRWWRAHNCRVLSVLG
jgi:hypothetical protein